MNYFQLMQGKELRHVIRLQWLEKQPFSYQISEEEFLKLPKLMVAYYTYGRETEAPEVLEHPAFMVSETIRRVLKMYEEDIPCKAIQVYPTVYEKKTAPVYEIPFIREAACLHPSSRIAPNGSVEELVLDADKLPGREIFRVGGILENRVIISLPVAESILRRNPYGVHIEEVRMM